MKYENHVRWDDAEPVEVFTGLTRRTLGTTDTMMICEFRAVPGATVPEHSHPHEQTGYVAKGQVIMNIGGQTIMCSEGDSYAIPSNVPHSAQFDVECTLIDVFSPPREEYRAPKQPKKAAQGPSSKYR